MIYSTKYSELVEIEANDLFSVNTYRIRLKTPGFIHLIHPGQFAMIRLADRKDPLLGRPFAIYKVDEQTGSVEFIYAVVGKMTGLLSKYTPGMFVELNAPLGNGWDLIEGNGGASDTQLETSLPFDHLMMIAGGVGQTPFLTLCQKYAHYLNKPRLTLLYGARSKERLMPLDDFAPYQVDIQIATEDGSVGHRGFVTDLIAGSVQGKTVVVACGPKPMLRAVFLEAKKLSLPCWTSLESPMSCGLGICFGCVVEYRADDGSWDYRRTCQDGPVFDAYRLKWD